MIRLPLAQSVRAEVFARDQGVCRLCGCPTLLLDRIVTAALQHWIGAGNLSRNDLLLSLGLPRNRLVLSDMDHIVPWYLGGKDEAANLRTLCLWCHKRVSRKQQSEFAKFKRLQAKALEKKSAAIFGSDLASRIALELLYTPKSKHRLRRLLEDCRAEVEELRRAGVA